MIQKRVYGFDGHKPSFFIFEPLTFSLRIKSILPYLCGQVRCLNHPGKTCGRTTGFNLKILVNTLQSLWELSHRTPFRSQDKAAHRPKGCTVSNHNQDIDSFTTSTDDCMKDTDTDA